MAPESTLSTGSGTTERSSARAATVASSLSVESSHQQRPSAGRMRSVRSSMAMTARLKTSVCWVIAMGVPRVCSGAR